MSTAAVVFRGTDGAERFIEEALHGVPPEQTIVVTGKHAWNSAGVGAWFENHRPGDYLFFDDFPVNPREEDLQRGLALFQARPIRAVIAAGGGSALDMAKLMAFFGPNQMGLDDYLTSRVPAAPARIPLLGIPTTAGTGAEATHFAVLYRGHVKYSVAHPAIRPSAVWLNPEFTASLPPYQTACTGMDALAQGAESYWAKGATEASRVFAAKAMETASRHLRDAVACPNPTNRAEMLEAAYAGGRAIDISKTTAPHAFSYILTSTFGLPHGHAVALLLPHFVEYHNRHGVQVPGISAEGIRQLIQDIGLARRLPMGAAELERLLADNVNLERLANNPVAIPREWISELARALAE